MRYNIENKLRLYLLAIYGDGGNLLKEVQEYGRDHEHARQRAAQNNRIRTVNVIVVGEI